MLSVLLKYLQPWFFDWIDFGANNVEPHTVPRISVYTGQTWRRLIYLIREYPNIFTVRECPAREQQLHMLSVELTNLQMLLENLQTKPYDAFNPLDDVWHGVVGEPGGFLHQPGT